MAKDKKLFIGVGGSSLLFRNPVVQTARYCRQGNAKGSSTPYGENFRIGKFAQTSDAKIYYEVYGNGAPVLILHGGCVGVPYEMGKIIDDLKKNYQVIAMSTRGHGRSEIGQSPMTYEQRVTDALAVLKEVTDKPVKIVGYGDGAYTAYKFAATNPAQVERIVGIGAGTLSKGYFSGTIDIDYLTELDAKFVDVQKKIRPEINRWQEFLNMYMEFLSNLSVGKEIFDAIKCPVLFIVGDEDDRTPVTTVLEAHQMTANSRLCVVPKAWHNVFHDNYEVMRPALIQFINAPINTLQTGSNKVSLNSRS